MKKIPGRKLAEGEATGHAHVLNLSDVFENEDGLREFVCKAGDTVVHEEHKPIEIPPGEYLAGQVLEYDHFEEEARAVMD